MNSVIFPTGNSYIGNYEAKTNTMTDMGTYTFSDGSEYRGSFKNGHFHGFGRLKIIGPEIYIFYAYFSEGNLLNIDCIEFSDGLRMFCDFKDDQLNTKSWEYCIPSDRRFAPEYREGIKAYNRTLMVPNVIPRELDANTYDTEEGVYIASTGFVTKIPEPFNSHHFVSSKEDMTWIEQNCRYGKADDKKDIPHLPTTEFRERIIKQNFNVLYKIFPEFFCSSHMFNVKDFDVNRINLTKITNVDSEVPTESSVTMSSKQLSTSSVCTSIDEHIEENIKLKCMNAVKSLHMQQPQMPQSDSETNLMSKSKKISILT